MHPPVPNAHAEQRQDLVDLDPASNVHEVLDTSAGTYRADQACGQLRGDRILVDI